ncbi:bifunctional helix-turn-helix transcriptional regulator/GNAT family N-acetyltransferase [Clostridium saccharoperbutylacetonicum]|uniref:bifunctional helix-turn-helix transcriptional regulator/GNAT family N-acetyltransferase n=1 Tax=Clostridium saccharoperbutylacetonicum TaxID=36745 RepID=UPI0039ECE1AE
MDDNIDIITDIRGFNRFYTNFLGLLDQHILDSGYSLTEARVIFEISKTEHCMANQLSSILSVDSSYMSRILAKFEKSGLIIRNTSREDNRNIEIRLSEKGIDIFHELNDRSNEQIQKILEKLNDEECEKIRDSMNTIKKYLTIATTNLSIRPYKKTDVEYVIDRQLSLYETERQFTSEVWKKYLVQGVLALVDKFNPEKDCMFILECNENPAGCVAITHSNEEQAQFRYFFLEPELRGFGAGQRLLDMALNFCKEKGYNHVFLWTVSAQETARNLYEKAGFKVTETSENSDWGVSVLEERWDLDI